MMKEIKTGGELLDGTGMLLHKGWARSPLLDYRRELVPVWRRLLRLREWEICTAGDEHVQLAVTVADLGFSGVVSINVADLDRGAVHTFRRVIPLTFGDMELPGMGGGDVMIREKDLAVDLTRSPGRRFVRIRCERFDDVKSLYVSLELACTGGDSLCTAIAYPETAGGFCYTDRILAMPAAGTIVYGADRWELTAFSPTDAADGVVGGTGGWGCCYRGCGVLPKETTRLWLMCGGGSGLPQNEQDVKGEQTAFNVGENARGNKGRGSDPQGGCAVPGRSADADVPVLSVPQPQQENIPAEDPAQGTQNAANDVPLLPVGVCVGDSAGFVCAGGEGVRSEPVSLQGMRGLRGLRRKKKRFGGRDVHVKMHPDTPKKDISLGFRSADGRMDLTFDGGVTAEEDFSVPAVIAAERRLIFGRCSGRVTGADGREIRLDGARAVFCEFSVKW